MSEKLTTIRLPGCADAGLADWGELTVPDMIAQFRSYHQQRIEAAQIVLAAADSDFRVTVVRGAIVNRHIKTLQEGRAALASTRKEP